MKIPRPRIERGRGIEFLRFVLKFRFAASAAWCRCRIPQSGKDIPPNQFCGLFLLLMSFRPNDSEWRNLALLIDFSMRRCDSKSRRLSRNDKPCWISRAQRIPLFYATAVLPYTGAFWGIMT